MPSLPLTQVDDPDLASISIQIPAAGVEYQHFLAYEFDDHYLTPSSAFWFDLDLDELTDDDRALLIPGQEVTVSVNGLQQCAGIIDETPIRTGHAGSVIHVECRDWMSPVVDGQVDVRSQFNPGMTVEQVVAAVFAPYGILTIADDNGANVNAMTGGIYGTKTSKTGKALKNVVAHQLKPYPREGAFAFAARVCQREGLWIRPTAAKNVVTVTAPNFDSGPLYTFLHSTSDPSQNNIVEGEVRQSRKNQPSIIFASGFGGGGVFPKSSIRCAIVNPLISADVSELTAAYPGIPVITFPSSVALNQIGVSKDALARPLYLYDPESHVQSEVEAFARREMSLRMRQALGIHYTIEGHTIAGTPVVPDTMAGVEDDRSNLHGSFWILGRNFSKSSGAGTRTRVEMILPNSLQF